MKRPPGHASVEEHPKGSGLYRVRIRAGKGFKTLGTKLSKGAANELADAQAAVRNAKVITDGLLLETFGIAFLARREEQGVRGVKKDAYRWDKHVAKSPLGKMAVAGILRSDVVVWRDKLQGKHPSKLKLLNLLRVALDEAVERGILDANPAREVKLHKSGRSKSTDDLEGILTPEEQGALIKAVPIQDRPAVVFALFTGLRLSEQWRLDWSDLTDSAVIVSKSVGGEGPKGGKVREVPLLPGALQAVQVQRAFGLKGPILFPGARRARRRDTKAPLSFASWVKAAGIKRHVTWHDLRHTCATALLAGWWGRKWSLDEVCKLLGHSSIAVTERYARKLNETLRLAVLGTSGPSFDSFPGGYKRELTMQNDSTQGAFVKHRSSVQIRQSAPALSGGVGEQVGNRDERREVEEARPDQARHSQGDADRSGGAGRAGAHLARPGRDGTRVDSGRHQARAPEAVDPAWFGPNPPPEVAGDFAWLAEVAL